MKQLKRALTMGWSAQIWPHYRGYSVVFIKGNGEERVGRGDTVRLAVKAALKGYKV